MQYYPEWLPPNWWWHLPELPRGPKALTFAKACQNSDGGFANWPGGVSYMECCFHAMVLINVLNAVGSINTSGITRFIRSRVNTDGGFADFPGEDSTLFNTFYAVVCLTILRHPEVMIREQLVRYLSIRQDIQSGGFSHDPGGEVNMIATFWATVSLAIIDASGEVDLEALATYIQACRHSEGGFGSRPGQPPYLEYTYQALTITRILGFASELGHLNRTASFVASCLGADGRFGERPGVPPTNGDTMWAVSCLSILDATSLVNLGPTYDALSRSAFSDLWSHHCGAVTFVRLLRNEIVIRPQMTEVGAIAVRDNHVVSINALSDEGITRVPPEIISFERESYRDLVHCISIVEEELASALEQQQRVRDHDFNSVLMDIGKYIADVLLTDNIVKVLGQQPPGFAYINISEDLAHVPWQLTYIDGEHMGLRHAMGTAISTSFRGTSPPSGGDQSVISVVLIGGDRVGSESEHLPDAETEVSRLAKGLSKSGHFSVKALYGERATRNSVLSLIDESQPDVLHFAGHVYYSKDDPLRSGLILADGKLESRLLSRHLSARPPKLVTLNSCESARAGVRSWRYQTEMFGLARTFLDIGSAYVGSYWPVADTDAIVFSQMFYSRVANGFPIGEALRLTRNSFRASSQGIGLAWASYNLFGDPMKRLGRFQYVPGSGRDWFGWKNSARAESPQLDDM